MPNVFTIEELRLFQRNNSKKRSWGLVPTMGALHQGHLQLIKKAHAENPLTFVSIFVNPTQFDSEKDLENYPSTIDDDVTKIRSIHPNICVFIPSVETIYPNGTTVKTYALKGLDKTMEGKHRPGHFNGVATVVERLFSLIQPDVAYFGQKDFQQLQIVSLLAKTLGIEIRSLPTVREANGLAMSSIKTKVIQKLYKTPNMELEYFEIAAADTLNIAHSKTENVSYRAFIAVVVEGTRLIDNIALN
jgi:pantoate--beta-alanine ligase